MTNYLFSSNDVKKIINHHRIMKSYDINKKRIKMGFPDFPVKGIQKILEDCFFATLKTEEGRFHNFSVVISPLQEKYRLDSTTLYSSKPFIFSQPLPFNIETLVKLSTALHNTEQNIEIGFDEKSNPHILGFNNESYTSLKIQSINTGKLFISFPWKFPTGTIMSRVAIIDGKEIKFWQESEIDYYSALFQSSMYKNFDEMTAFNWMHDDYEYLIKKIYTHGHGGILIFVGNGNSWKKSVQTPIKFSPNNKFKEIRRQINKRNVLSEKDKKTKKLRLEYEITERHLESLLNLLSQLTALDGATIITKDFELLAFGAKLKPVNTQKRPNDIVIVELPNEKEEKAISSFSGTRHQSTAQFIYDQRNSVAVVASQDGKVSIIYWDNKIEKVRVVQHAEYLFR